MLFAPLHDPLLDIDSSLADPSRSDDALTTLQHLMERWFGDPDAPLRNVGDSEQDDLIDTLSETVPAVAGRDLQIIDGLERSLARALAVDLHTAPTDTRCLMTSAATITALRATFIGPLDPAADNLSVIADALAFARAGLAALDDASGFSSNPVATS